MGKVAYSLVLSEEIVAKIDTMASREGFSRSAFIDHILAEYTCLSTSRQIRKNTIASVEQAVTSLGFRGSVSSGGILTLRTALRYKYNPALHYVVELYEGKEWLGRLKVDLRSQNETLLSYIQLFFKLWCKLEDAYLPNPAGHLNTIEPKRYVRIMRIPAVETQEELGEAIAEYVTLLDTCIKTYFTHVDKAETAIATTEAVYAQGVKKMRVAKEL